MMIKRYEIHLANLDPSLGSEIRKTRRIVVVSDDLMNKTPPTVVACPLTTKLHPGWRSRIQTICDGTPAEIAVDQIRTTQDEVQGGILIHSAQGGKLSWEDTYKAIASEEQGDWCDWQDLDADLESHLG